MSYVSIFCFLAALGIIVSMVPRGADVLSPARVFGLVWTVAIGLADLKLSRLQHTWDTLAWLVIGIGVASFFLGVLLVRASSLREPNFMPAEMRHIIRATPVNASALYASIILLVSLYSISYMIEWQVAGVLPAFAAEPEPARRNFGVFGFHLIVVSMPAILFLIAEYFLLVKRNVLRKIVLAWFFVLVFVSSFLLLNRLFYVFFLILVIGFAYYATTHIKLHRAAIPIAALIGILAYLQSVREGRYARNYLYVVSGMKFSETYAALAGPYMYIVMNLENFARAVTRLDQHVYGYFTFDFLLALTGLKHPIASYFGLEKNRFLSSGYNTFPYLWEYYYDFGLLGVALFSLLFGFGVALVHQWMRQRPTFVSITAYAALVYVLVLSFFTNSLTALNFNFNLFLLVVSQIVLVRASGQWNEGKGKLLA